MATFTMTKEQLATATLECIQAHAIELGSPLSDEDATLLSTVMNVANVGEVTEEKFNLNKSKIKNTTKEQFDGMLMMARMMSGGAGAEAMAQQMATATMSEKKLSPVEMGKVQERRISRRKSFLEKQAKEQEAIEKAKAERIRMKKTATEMFTSEGVESVPFSFELDDAEKMLTVQVLSSTADEPITSTVAWRGYHFAPAPGGHSQEAASLDKIMFFENGSFTIAKNSATKGFFASGFYFCREDTGQLTGRIDEVIMSNSIMPSHEFFSPKVGDFLEGNYNFELDRLDPKKINITFVAGRGRTRSRGGSGGGSGSFGDGF